MVAGVEQEAMLRKEYQNIRKWFSQNCKNKKKAYEVATLVIRLHEDNRTLEADNLRLRALLTAREEHANAKTCS